MFTRMAEGLNRTVSSAPVTRFGALVGRMLNSPACFYGILALLIFQALWIAVSARYPQAFDEQYHFGLIKLHAAQWLPFFTSQPANAEVYGPIARDPSYFFHFLLSLPYRLLKLITDNMTVQIISLRLMNIAMFAWGIFVYRQLFNRLGVSRRLRNTVLLFFVLTPIVPLLASQINYDNLIFPLTGLMFLYTVRYLDVLKREERIHVQLLFELMLYGLFAAIVKYTSLPLFIAVIGLILWRTWRVFRQSTTPMRQLLTASKKWVLIVYAGLFLVIGGLFVERYGVNMVRFNSPAPDCATVIGDALCQSYPPYARDSLFARTLPRPTLWGQVVYPFVWFHRMIFETMFVIASYYGDNGLVTYIPAPPLTVANYTAWIVVIAGLILLVYFRRKLWSSTYVRGLLLVIAFYVIILLLKNFANYLQSGEAVAIHGRYLVPMYPVLYLALALGFAWWLERIKRPELKPLLVVLVLVPFLQGAGLVGWLFRSTPMWYWSQDPSALVYRVNQAAQNVAHRIIIP